MHYGEFKQSDTELLRSLIRAFPFATIAINGKDRPIVAHAPLTVRSLDDQQTAIDFHLAKKNEITTLISGDQPATVIVSGPGAHISPSWYVERFPSPASDRSRTAPTYNYVCATLYGRLHHLPSRDLRDQIAELVRHHEPSDGWKFHEIAPDILDVWCNALNAFRMEIEHFEITAKVSQDRTPGDRSGVVEGLRRRAELQDEWMAELVKSYDGSPNSLTETLKRFTRRA